MVVDTKTEQVVYFCDDEGEAYAWMGKAYARIEQEKASKRENWLAGLWGWILVVCLPLLLGQCLS